jgi:hypothetical protein
MLNDNSRSCMFANLFHDDQRFGLMQGLRDRANNNFIILLVAELVACYVAFHRTLTRTLIDFLNFINLQHVFASKISLFLLDRITTSLVILLT